MTALILVTIALGMASGVTEGMVMVRLGDQMYLWRAATEGAAGVRLHRWFRGYHAIDLAAYVMCAHLSVLLWVAWPGWITAAGLGVLVWEAREAGYAVARWGRAIPEHEHLTFADILSYNLNGRAVRSLHGARMLTAMVLLIIGGMT